MAAARSQICSWGNVILLSKFTLLFLDSGIAKSFGVLIPLMVQRLDSDYATVGLICSMPASLTYLFFPFVTMMLQRLTNRSVAMAGGVLSGSSILACAFLSNTTAVGVCLALSGIGVSMAYLPSVVMVNEYFPQKFIFLNTITLYGYTAGSMLLPIMTEKAIEAYGLSGAFIILGGIAFNIVACGATFRRAPGRDVMNKRGANQQAIVEERECLIKGEALQRNVELVPQEDISNDENEFEDNMVEQNSQMQNGSRENDKSCHLPSETSPNIPPAACSLWTFIQSCGIFKETLFLFSLPMTSLLHYELYAWMLFLVPHAEHLGIPQSRAVFLSTVGGIGGVIGRTFFIILTGKGIDLFIVYIIVGIISTASFLMDFISSAYEVRAVLAFLQGFCFFIEDTSGNVTCKMLVFDDRNFGMAVTIYGFLGGLGASCSGLFTGYLFDVTQSFTKVFIIVGFIHAIIVINLIIIIILFRKRK